MIPNAWAGFDFGLGPDIEMLRKTAHDFAQDRIAPRADAHDTARGVEAMTTRAVAPFCRAST